MVGRVVVVIVVNGFTGRSLWAALPCSTSLFVFRTRNCFLLCMSNYKCQSLWVQVIWYSDDSHWRYFILKIFPHQCFWYSDHAKISWVWNVFSIYRLSIKWHVTFFPAFIWPASVLASALPPPHFPPAAVPLPHVATSLFQQPIFAHFSFYLSNFTSQSDNNSWILGSDVHKLLIILTISLHFGWRVEIQIHSF